MDDRENDYAAIRNLLARYSQTFDLGDADGVASLYLEIGVLDTTAPTPATGGIFRGRSEIRDHVAAVAARTAGRVRTSPAQSMIELQGDSAQVTSYAIGTRDYGPPEIPGDLTHSELITTGMYFDELRRLDGQWLFERRIFRHDALPDVIERVGRPVTAGPANRIPHTVGGGTTTITRAGIPELDRLLDKTAAMYQYEREQVLEPWIDLWAEDAKVRFPIESETGVRNIDGKAAIVKWNATKFIERASTDINARLEAIAGSRRVVAHLEVFLHFTNGLGIAGPLVVIFTFDESERIVLMEEYVNDVGFPPHYKSLATPDESVAAAGQ